MNLTFTLADQTRVIATGLTLAEAHARLIYIARKNDLTYHLHLGGWAGHALSTAYPKGGDNLFDAQVWVRVDREPRTAGPAYLASLIRTQQKITGR